MSTEAKNGINWVAVITMMFLCGMIAFVTYLGQPLSNVWKAQEAIKNSTLLALLGNAMVFVAYLFMGIPGGKLLGKVGYKKTALIGIAAGFVAMAVQMLSGKLPMDGGVALPYGVYLVGGFIGGISACLLNMVVNPMLNLLGGGGKRGNQLNMAGMTFNSLTATVTPLIVGSLVGAVTAETSMADCDLLMYIALGVFAASFIIISLVTIKDPEQAVVTEKIGAFAPLRFRHCLLGVLAIFAYMGVEAGIPGVMTQWLTAEGGPLAATGNAAAIAGAVVAVYWLLMFVGRLIGAAIGGKVSSRTMMIVTSGAAILFIVLGTLTTGIAAKMPVLSGGVKLVDVPLAAIFFALCGLCASVMWPAIFNLATEKLGKYTAAASGLFMMMVFGGFVFQILQGLLIDSGVSFMVSFVVPGLALAYIFIYTVGFSKPAANIEELVK
ncbi:MAG TPA: MFS transporter [Candidatus Spyradenecus faecavium]|uniref:MFS transporter n=1 Tax=Candidatus Spyradenecus faecavium TaxID=2840947 RepID=A0A9D1T2Q8_9BACT|nr:MFS transporter [Candidatus Spyradenecus faecavium]